MHMQSGLLAAIGSLVAGAGAFATAFVTLCLARNAQKIKLDITCSIRIVEPGKDALTERAVVLTVENWDSRSVTVKKIKMEVGKESETIPSIWALNALDYKKPGVKEGKLEDGETVEFAYQLHAIKDMFKKMAKKKSDAKKVRFVICTTRNRQSESVVPDSEEFVSAMVNALNTQT